MAKDLTPVPSPKGDGCLLAKVNALRDVTVHELGGVAPVLWADVDAVRAG